MPSSTRPSTVGSSTGSSTQPPKAANRPTPRLQLLTPRERDVLIEVAKGSSNAEVAIQLDLAEAIADTYVGHILAKLALRPLPWVSG